MRLPLLAICLVAVVALTAAAALSLSGDVPGVAMTSSGACYLPTPAPRSTPVPDNSISLCNMTGQAADGLEFYVGGPMSVQPVIAVNAAGCGTPSATSFESPPDFTTKITVTWPSACVGPGAAVEIAFDCSHLDETPPPCQLEPGCVSWTLAGQPLGPACPTPNCGGVPCCNGLPCPTATPTPTGTPLAGVPVAPGTPGDYDCDNVITASDAGRLLAELAGAPYLPLGRPCSIPAGISPQDMGDPTCDGVVDVRDVLAILLIVAELRVPRYCS
jgi:hypothetical protein